MFRIAFFSLLLALVLTPLALLGLARYALELGLSFLTLGALSLGIGLSRRP